MNIQILSNSKNKVGTTNKINEFNMKLVEPIDAKNQDKYIIPLNVSYPLTTINIRENDCWFYLKLQFIKPNSSVSAVWHPISDLKFESSKVILPDGIYNIENVIDYINNFTEEYNVTFRKLQNNKIRIDSHLGYYYYYLQTKNTDGGSTSWQGRV